MKLRIPSSRSLRAGRLLTLPLAAMFLLAGCDSSSSSTDPNGDTPDATTFSVYLTDNPGEVADVWVEIADIRLVGQGQPRSLLDERTELISLLELQDTELLIVQDHEVEPGTYSQLRFVIDAAVLETVGGDVYALGGAEHPFGMATTGELHCPSCAQSGLKVNFAGGLVIEEGQNAALVDFDVSQSFGRQAGQSGRWVMHPVIQGVMVDPIDPTPPNAGWIVGEVQMGDLADLPACGGHEPGLDDFVPLATSTALVDDENDPFTFAGSTAWDGTFEIEVLDADIYELGYRQSLVLDGWELVWEADVAPGSISVEAGETASGVVYTLVSATCVDSD
jgi:hypothetical protein